MERRRTEEDKMQVKQVRLQELRPYEANAKKHDDRQIKNVAESIRQYGFVQPLVADRNGVIVSRRDN